MVALGEIGTVVVLQALLPVSPLGPDIGQRRKIAERYAADETMAELAREYECGEATIWRALRAPA